MEATGGRPWAIVTLVAGDGHRVELGPLRRSTPCDLEVVDRLLRLQLAARRAGWRVELSEVDEELAALMALVGAAAVLGPVAGDHSLTTGYSSRKGGSPKSAKRSG